MYASPRASLPRYPVCSGAKGTYVLSERSRSVESTGASFPRESAPGKQLAIGALAVWRAERDQRAGAPVIREHERLGDDPEREVFFSRGVPVVECSCLPQGVAQGVSAPGRAPATTAGTLATR